MATETKTYRVRGQALCHEIVRGLINHRQSFSFRPDVQTEHPNDQYEFVLDASTPESGYGFIPTKNHTLFETENGYGLFIE